MRETKVANRYAKSLLELSLEMNKLNEAVDDMKLLINVCHSTRKLSVLLKSPIVRVDLKTKILHDIFSGKIGKLSMAFIDIIITKRRENILEDIAIAFIKQYKKHSNITTAKVTSAVTLDNGLRKRIQDVVLKAYKGTVEMEEKTDPDLIGGMVLRIEDLEYNASIRKRLTNFSKDFNNNPYVQDF